MNIGCVCSSGHLSGLHLSVLPPLTLPPLALSLSLPLLVSANLFFAFYCLSLPALLWPVKLSPLTKWLMTKVNSPSSVLSVSAVSAPCAAPKIFISWTDENPAARSSDFSFFFFPACRRKSANQSCDRINVPTDKGHDRTWCVFLFLNSLKSSTEARTSWKPAPPGPFDRSW